MLQDVLKKMPDPRGKQGRKYPLWALLGLIVVGILCGRQGLMAVHRLGRKLTASQRSALGFMDGRTPAHATLTEMMRCLDDATLAHVLGQVRFKTGEDERHIAMDGKTLCGSADADGKAMHCVTAFCVGLQQAMGQEAVRGKGLEIPAAIALLRSMDLHDKVVTGDALLCQKEIAALIVKRGGDYVLPVKDNQRLLKEDIQTAFETPIFPPQHLHGNPA